MEKLIYDGVEFNVGDTVGYTDTAIARAINEGWADQGFVIKEDLYKEHKIIGFTNDTNASGWNNMLLDHEYGETAPEHLKLIKKAE